MMRVLHVHSGNLYGGVETFLVTLAREAGVTPGMSSSFALCFDGRLRQELLRVQSRLPTSLAHVRLRRPDRCWRARRAWRTASSRSVRCRRRVISHGCTRSSARRSVVPGFRLMFWLHTVSDGRHWLERWPRTTGPDLALSAIVASARPAASRSGFRATRAESCLLSLAFAI